ncbi:MAG: ferredoxin--NADP reductase [Myxococcales bacterium]|nr:ferredoxin--NADP reductase [Myxococcales bacterium]
MSTVTLIERHDWAPGLATFRLDATPQFAAGQFFNFGVDTPQGPIRRSYSAASAPGQALEFYVTEVSGGALTPSLFGLRPGDALELDPKPQGFFTLNYVPEARDAWLLATGTGLGPFISMLRDAELWGHFQRVFLVHGVRERAHFAYADELRELETKRGNFRYLRCVSREEPAPGEAAGRIPAALADGRLQALAGAELEPEHSHVLLCGNPRMIDDTHEALKPLGLIKHRVRKPGHISSEKYW